MSRNVLGHRSGGSINHANAVVVGIGDKHAAEGILEDCTRPRERRQRRGYAVAIVAVLMRASDCRDLLETVASICRFRGSPVVLSRELIAEAAGSFIGDFA